MKKVFIPIIITLIIGNLYAQDKATYEALKQYTKGDNTIKIITSDSIGLAYKKIGSLVIDYGFNIKNMDKELYFINTEYTSLNDYTYKSRIDVRLKTSNDGTLITIRGEAVNMGFNFKAENYYRKDVSNGVFAQMYEIALGYDNGNISTAKEK